MERHLLKEHLITVWYKKLRSHTHTMPETTQEREFHPK